MPRCKSQNLLAIHGRKHIGQYKQSAIPLVCKSLADSGARIESGGVYFTEISLYT